MLRITQHCDSHSMEYPEEVDFVILRLPPTLKRALAVNFAIGTAIDENN